jgi:hypothetical protein
MTEQEITDKFYTELMSDISDKDDIKKVNHFLRTTRRLTCWKVCFATIRYGGWPFASPIEMSPTKHVDTRLFNS